MKLRSVLRTVVSFMLSVMLLCSGGISAFAADRTDPVRVVNGIEVSAATPEAIEKIDGSIVVSRGGSWNVTGLEVENLEPAEGESPAGDVRLEVTGAVSSENVDGKATGGSVFNESDTQLNVTLGDGVSAASSAFSPSTGLSAESANEDAGIQVDVTGDVNAETGDKDYATTGISSSNYGGTIHVQVNGDVRSQGTGIYANSDAYRKSRYVYREEDIAAYKDQATLVHTFDDGTEEYEYEGDDGCLTVSWFVSADGEFNHGWINTTTYNKGLSDIQVSGNVEGNVFVSASADSNPVTVGIGGDVSGILLADADAEQSKVEVTVGKDLNGEALATAWENSEARISVDGSIMSRKDSGRLSVVGVNAAALNGTTAATVGKDVTVQNAAAGKAFDAYGIFAQARGEKSELSIHAGGDVTASASVESGNGGTGIQTVNGGGQIQAGVEGSVSADTTGIFVSTEQEEKYEDLSEEEFDQIKGRASFDGKDEDGCLEYSLKEGNTEYTYLTDEDGAFLYGTKATIVEYAGVSDISVGGDVRVEEQPGKRDETGIRVKNSMEEQRISIAVDGSVQVHGDKDHVVVGISSNSNAGSNTVSVGSNVESSKDGIRLEDDSEEDYKDLTEEELDAIKDRFSLYEEEEYEDAEGVHHTDKTYFYEDENKNSYYYILTDGELSDAYAWIRNDKKAVNRIEVGGDVTVSTEDNDSTGVYLSTSNRFGEETVNIGGNVNVQGHEKGWLGGVEAFTHYGSSEINVGGNVRVQSENAVTNGVFAHAARGEENITIAGGVSVEGKPICYPDEEEEGGYYREAIRAVSATAKGQESRLSVTVLDDVTATAVTNPELSTALEVRNWSGDNQLGELSVLVTGNAQSTGTALQVDSGNGDGETAPESGQTDIAILGDVRGDSIGIELKEADNTNILIDGTVSGSDSAVLVGSGVIADTLNMTVWEIQPDDEGHYTEKVVGEDGEGNPVTAEDESILERMQYIIRIEPRQRSMITLQGTTVQDGYQVAREGDVVTLKLDIPKGYMLNGVYGNVPRDFRLLQDDNGDYYMVVPRGGGVYLSLDLKRGSDPGRNGTRESVTATLYPNGGSIMGNPEAIRRTVLKGMMITLPQPDARDGYAFAGWYAADIGPDAPGWTEPAADEAALIPGETEVRIQKNTCFTAIWEKME